MALRIAVQYRLPQTRLDTVELGTGIAQAGDLDDRLRPEVQPCAHRQAQQIDAARRDILPHLPRTHGETVRTEFVV